ncbi:putative Amastin surface glycoprotein [Leishmania shawi]|uniref:Amastin surface glycoprotein n=1 Tax=Leishmania shawi TaxID=5680 RepID=A0AAW3CD56_9TRYP
MEWNIALLVYVVLQFIAFLFVLVATPLDMFRFKPNFRRIEGCVTLWGHKTVCNSMFYDRNLYEAWGICPSRLMRFRVADAFAIISIVVYGAAFILGVIMLFCCSCLRFVCVLLNIVGAVTVCVVWATMVVTFFKDDDEDCPALQGFAQYGVGFALLIIAWVLDVINIIFLVLSMTTAALSASGQVEQEERKL